MGDGRLKPPHIVLVDKGPRCPHPPIDHPFLISAAHFTVPYHPIGYRPFVTLITNDLGEQIVVDNLCVFGHDGDIMKPIQGWPDEGTEDESIIEPEDFFPI
jgi:hypothetical protein